ncbi:M28 family metallopeptidase [Nonomuraea sp. NPDC050556]|uniref:M28 family metallopeptidase n=1 Tax=Nonomuraea sp. NPDC050556 TaxID=3364369 RepID=UPI0037A8AFBA
MTTVQTLAGGPFTGRRVGTAGSALARAWLAGQLRELGVEPTVDTFPVSGVRELYAVPTMHWTRDLRYRREFAEDLASADLPEPREGLVVAADSQEWRARWVLAPAAWTELLERAVREGAAGLVVPRGTDEAGWMPKMIAGRPPAAVPILGVRNDIHRQMGATGGSLTASMPLRTVDVTGTNVHADLISGQSGPTVLLTAHYDGVGDDPHQRFPAAADNASGVAAVLEAARRLREDPPKGLNVSIAFLDAEEAGAHGSAHHAPKLPPGTMVINMDGAAEAGRPAAVEAGGPAHAVLAALDRAGREVGVPLKAAPMASDNRRYAAAGLAAVGIGMGMPGYQTPAETPDRVDPAALLAAARLITATVRLLAPSPEGGGFPG